MNDFLKAVRVAVIALCVALFLMGIIWNLFYGTLPEEDGLQPTAVDASDIGLVDTAAQEQQYTIEMQQAAAETEAAVSADTAVIGTEDHSITEAPSADEQALINQLAALRMERDSSWQRLKDGRKSLSAEEQQSSGKAYEELQYKEQRLELLLQAKGLPHCLVLLEEQQANVIVGGAELADQYQKIFDLVQRNTSYGPEQIVIIPLTAENEDVDGAGA